MNKQNGYTLLFAIIITTIVLAVGVSILTIARKEVLLSSGARESQAAIYMADNGLECAEYWDANNTFSYASTQTTLQCDGTSHAIEKNDTSADKWERSFIITSSGLSGAPGLRCAEVTVYKERKSGIVETTYVSKGYNIGGKVAPGTGEETCDQPNLNRVERALEFTYR